jgi:hypothetical protein
MAVQWPQLLAPEIRPDDVLHDWRARIARLEAQETAHFASLPYVTGLAVMGSVGQGTIWPLSDLDLFVVGDAAAGQAPRDLIRAEEEQRNRLLRAAGLPGGVEAAGWVVTTAEAQAAVEAEEETFFHMLEQRHWPHWWGIVLRLGRARVVHDRTGALTQLVQRCEAALREERFLSLWLDIALRDEHERLAEAADHVARGDWLGASRAVLRSDGASICYARWRRLPENLCRGVTHFLRACGEAGNPEIGDLFLTANRLHEDQVWQRFAAVPPEGQRECEVWLAIRRETGEEVSELAATRDLLYVNTRMSRRAQEAWPAWMGATDDEAAVHAQCRAARELVRRAAAEA